MGGAFPLFCCCWGERAHIHTERSLSSPIHTHTTPSLLSPSTRTYTHTHTSKKIQHQRADTAEGLLQPHTGSSIRVCSSVPPLQPASTWYSPSIPCQVAFTHGGEACLKQLLTSYKQDSLPFPPLSFAFFSSPLSRAPTTHVCFAPQPSLLLTPLALSVPPPFLSPLSPPLASSLSLSFSPTYPPHSPLSL